jgi:hypothetical protein
VRGDVWERACLALTPWYTCITAREAAFIYGKRDLTFDYT